jgi:hypothetical protein
VRHLSCLLSGMSISLETSDTLPVLHFLTFEQNLLSFCLCVHEASPDVQMLMLSNNNAIYILVVVKTHEIGKNKFDAGKIISCSFYLL